MLLSNVVHSTNWADVGIVAVICIALCCYFITDAWKNKE